MLWAELHVHVVTFFHDEYLYTSIVICRETVLSEGEADIYRRMLTH